jgi:hypothetical protein
MNHHSDEELGTEAAVAAVRRQLVARRRRCLMAAGAFYLPGVAAVVFLCLTGLRPAAVAVPVFLSAASLLLGAASAVLFARLAHLQLSDIDDGSDDDDQGPGGSSGHDPEAPSGGGLEVDWDRFEQDFRAYCERATAVPA